MRLSRSSARRALDRTVAWVLATRQVPGVSVRSGRRTRGGPGETGRVSVGTGTARASTATIESAPGTSVDIGAGVVLAPFSRIECHRTSVTVGDGVRIDPHAAIVDWWGPDRPSMPAPPAAPVVVGAYAHLGTGCVIGPGVTVGPYARVLPGTAVFEDVPPGDGGA